MGKGSKRRTGEDIKNIVSNWDEINWGCIKQTQDKETNKNKDDRKELNDNDNRRD